MRRSVVLASIAALVLVFLVRWQFPDDRGARLAPSLPDTRFDYTLSDFNARFLDAEGRVELLVSAPRLEHDSELRLATIFEPRFHIEPQNANWQGSADRALLLRADEVLTLEGNVILEHPTSQGQLRVLAERLHHHSGTRTITSSSPVSIQSPGSLVQAGAMRVRLDDDIVEFSDHVQGELHPGRSGPGPDLGQRQR